MRMYIPELGDEIVLSENWNFTLFNEYRNKKLFEQFLNKLFIKPIDIKYYVYQNHTTTCNWSYYDCNCEYKKYSRKTRKTSLATHSEIEEFNTYSKQLAEYNSNINSYKELSVTLDAGTKLKVDRIYVRKGLSNYSSISFFIKSGPYNGKRFWAKLSEVNNIEFLKD